MRARNEPREPRKVIEETPAEREWRKIGTMLQQWNAKNGRTA
jgi:hypothetical protein